MIDIILPSDTLFRMISDGTIIYRTGSSCPHIETSRLYESFLCRHFHRAQKIVVVFKSRKGIERKKVTREIENLMMPTEFYKFLLETLNRLEDL